MRAIEFLKGELSCGWFGAAFLCLGLLTQVVAYLCCSNEGLLPLVSGATGIFSVVLCSQRKITYYIFAWAQLATYVVLAYRQHFYGELAENVFYAVTMLYGMWDWASHYDTSSSEPGVVVKRLSNAEMAAISVFCAAGTLFFWRYLSGTDDTQPFMDSLSTVPAVIAQMLMITRYREQWLFWMVIDVASIFMWAVAGDWCMAAQFAFWTANCIYGYMKWSKA